LYLADRNILIDQTMVNDFRPFGPAMAKLSTRSKTIDKLDGKTIELTTALDSKRRINTAYEIYLGLYQAITGPDERTKRVARMVTQLLRESGDRMQKSIVFSVSQCRRRQGA